MFALLWILSLLLIVAASFWLVALSARIWWFLNPLVLIAAGCCLSGAGGYLFFQLRHIEQEGNYRLGMEWPAAILLLLGVASFLGVAIFGNQKVAEKTRGQEWRLGRLTLVLAGVFGIWAGCIGWLYQQANSAVIAADVKALAEIKSASIPEKTADENAAVLFRSVIQQMSRGNTPKEIKDLVYIFRDKGKLPDNLDATSPDIVKHVDSMKLFAASFRDIAAVPYYHGDIDRTSVYRDSPYVDAMSTAEVACLLFLEGRLAATRGDTKLAMENLLAVFRMADQVGQEPLWIDQHHSRILAFMALKELRFQLANFVFDDEALKVLAEWKPTLRWPSVPSVFRHQYPVDIHRICSRDLAARYFSEIPEAKGLKLLTIEIPVRIFFLPDDFKNYHDNAECGMSLEPQLLYLNKEKVLAMEKRWKELPKGIFVKRLSKSPEEAYAEAATQDAINQLALLAVAMHRFRIAKGAFPDSLTELKEMFPEVDIVDPFVGEPFRLIKRFSNRATLRCGSLLGDRDEELLNLNWFERLALSGMIDVRLVAVDAPPMKEERAESPADGASVERGSDGP